MDNEMKLIKQINEEVNHNDDENFDVSLTPEQLSALVDMASEGTTDEQEFVEKLLDILEDVPGAEMEKDREQMVQAALSEWRSRQL